MQVVSFRPQSALHFIIPFYISVSYFCTLNFKPSWSNKGKKNIPTSVNSRQEILLRSLWYRSATRMTQTFLIKTFAWKKANETSQEFFNRISFCNQNLSKQRMRKGFTDEFENQQDCYQRLECDSHQQQPFHPRDNHHFIKFSSLYSLRCQFFSRATGHDFRSSPCPPPSRSNLAFAGPNPVW